MHMSNGDYSGLIKDVLLVIIGPISAIVSAWLTNRYSERRLDKEVRNRVMTELISTRRKALQDVNAIMVDCHFKLNLYGNVPPTTLQIFNQEVGDPVQRFEDTVNANSVWYSHDLLNKINGVRGSFRQVKFAIYLSLPTSQLPAGISPTSYPTPIRNIDWRKFIDSFGEASAKIRQDLGIPSLENYLKTTLKQD